VNARQRSDPVGGQQALRSAAEVFQTVHPYRSPHAGSLIGPPRFERPVVTATSPAALAQLAQLQDEPQRRLWLCGAYVQAGIPLLESAVRSAHEVATRLGAPLDAGPGATGHLKPAASWVR
jgi:uncharacterized protein